MNNYNYFNEMLLGQNYANNLNNNNNDLFGPFEGYVKGNLFRNLYMPYKNYQPAQLIPRNEQEELLLNLNQMQFAMHELNLYLDVFPNDNNAMMQLMTYRNNYNKEIQEYENKYGAINNNNNTLNNIPFGWSTTPWPWNRRNI